MSKEKQIEENHELSESIYMSGHGLDWKDSDDIAEQLYHEGYRKQSEWISVDERLPEKFTNVLCLYPSRNYGGNIVVDYMESDRGCFAEQFKYGEPTHWMPLPEAPKMKGGAE